MSELQVEVCWYAGASIICPLLKSDEFPVGELGKKETFLTEGKVAQNTVILCTVSIDSGITFNSKTQKNFFQIFLFFDFLTFLEEFVISDACKKEVGFDENRSVPGICYITCKKL